MSETPALTLGAARQLLAAQVACLAAELDVPAMLIKGQTLAAHGLREPRESADVDILASPAGLARLQAALEEAGWKAGPDTTAHIIPQHSATLTHQYWPLELDLHWYFPGFLAEWQVSFDALWERRQSIELAHQTMFMPDAAGSALIAALHYERAPEWHPGAIEDLAARCRSLLGPDALVEIAQLAAVTGCADTLSTFLADIGASVAAGSRSDRQALADWNLNRAAGRTASVAWLDAVRKASWRQRPGILWRALMSTEADLRYLYPDAPAGMRGLWLARVLRFKYALRHGPRSARAYWPRR